MDVSDFFPIWDDLTKEEQRQLMENAREKQVSPGLLPQQKNECEGLILLQTGQLRTYIMSPDGKEVTLYRLLPGDICLFSAACMLQEIRFDILIEAEKDSTYHVIPAHQFKQMMEQSVTIANYTNGLLSTRFSEVMWLLEQIMWQSMDKRLATFLVEESQLEASTTLHLTHEKIASHLGTAREVVTRMLKYFQREGWISLNRGEILIRNFDALAHLAS
ncbi:MAG: Crp/Fnr family transcriptional regulator [Lachnospiraceae bacterium]|nr:Crp/Fnr family transcriptional regulator [Lachnospiraceae bacterium]